MSFFRRKERAAAGALFPFPKNLSCKETHYSLHNPGKRKVGLDEIVERSEALRFLNIPVFRDV